MDAPRSLAQVAPARAHVAPPDTPPPGELAGLLARVARERGLEPRALPQLVSVSGAELTREAVEQLRSSTPERARSAIERTLSRLELVPPGFDWLSAIEQALEGHLQAFYDPERRSIFIDRALSGGARRRTLAHELVHALQDQHHDLGARLAFAPDAWDRNNALHALAEGDAEALVARLGLTELAAPGPRALADEPLAPRAEVPGVLMRSFAAAYEDGRAFVEPVLARGGFGAVDELFKAPPATTHDLLHPLLPSRESMPSLGPAAAPGSDWELGYSDLLGEQTWRIVLEEWLPDARAERGAAGWLGDRLTLFEHGGATALVWQLRSEAGALGAVRSAMLQQFGATPLTITVAASRTGRLRSSRRGDFDCRPHRDLGVVGVLSDTRDLWFMSLEGDTSVDASCHALAAWAERL